VKLGAGVAERVQVHARGPLDDLLPGVAVEVSDRRPGQELQVVDRLGEVRPELTAAGDAPGGEEVLPGRLVVRERHVERPVEPGRGRDQAKAGAVEVRERGRADRRDQRVVRLGRVAVGLERDVGAPGAAVAGLAVRVEDVREPVVGHHADLRAAPAAAVHVADDRISRDSLPHDRKELPGDNRDPSRPA